MSLEFVLDLWRQRILTPGQVCQVMESLRPSGNSLAPLALQHDLLSIRQVVEIYDLQATNRRSFGAWAIALGWLTEDDLESLLVRQKLDRRAVRQALIDLKLLSATEVAALERAFLRRSPRSPQPPARVRPPKFRQSMSRGSIRHASTR